MLGLGKRIQKVYKESLMENYLPTLMYIISGIMLGYTALSIYNISQHMKNQARDIEKRFDYKNEGKQIEK